ncbi:hypothetical protein [Streptomyces sp. NPDC058092]|uniref:hypothetical protein n=1 Tax=Streptomyces sp. NPDC058092 TaxID=3346336 RepID=UPI0036F1937D
MTTHQVPPVIMEFYTSTIIEADRLSVPADGVLEMVRTQELLRRFRGTLLQTGTESYRLQATCDECENH